jgi:hypothetical protein
MNARPLCVGPGLYFIGASADPANLQQIAQEFRDILVRGDHDGKEWSDVIDVQVVGRDAIQAICQTSYKRKCR